MFCCCGWKMPTGGRIAMNLSRIRGLQAEVTRIENFSPHGRSRRQAYEKIVGKTDL
jgi:hypothetical protein